MSAAAAVLSHLKAAGVRLEVSGGSIVATPRDALTDTHRALIRTHKCALVDLLTNVTGPARRLWLIHHLAGFVESHSFTPPATLAEVRAWYPTALAVEPEN